MLILLACSSCIDGSQPINQADSLPEVTPTAFPVTTEEFPSPEPPILTPTLENTPEPACVERSGILQAASYESEVLDEILDVQVYLPPCYKSSDLEYPAAYFFHGSPPRSADWVQLGIKERMDEGVEAGRYPPAVLVFPLIPDDIFLWSDGGPGSYEEEFFLGLVPFVENTYRIESRGDARSVAGISRGGIWALELSLAHPDDFFAAAALSPALQYNSPRPLYDPFEIPGRMEIGPRRLLLLAGEGDWARDETEELAEILESYKRPVTLVLSPGGHEIDLWKNELDRVLSFLFSE